MTETTNATTTPDLRTPPTAQQLYDEMCADLCRPGRRQATLPSGACRYRTKDGNRCVVGARIPDDRYDPTFEGMGVSLLDWDPTHQSYMDRMAILAAANIPVALAPLAADLQEVHDSQNWARNSTFIGHAALRDVAERFGLVPYQGGPSEPSA